MDLRRSISTSTNGKTTYGFSRPNGKKLDDICCRETASIKDLVAAIDRSARIGMCLIVDEHLHLKDTVTDGDVRRALLAGHQLSDSALAVLAIKEAGPISGPVTAKLGTKGHELLDMMKLQGIRQIPIITSDGSLFDIVILADLLSQPVSPLQAVVMAGGFGTRLRPLTQDTPKPMLPVGGRPLIERIIEQLGSAGITNITVATHFQAQVIVDHLGNGKKFGVHISYVHEENPLGSAGALGLMPKPEHPFFVINGDILTDINFRAMHAYHEEHKAKITVAVQSYEIQIPYGVVEYSGAYLQSLSEKPQLRYFVNAGIYLLDPDVYNYIPTNSPLNMPDLIEILLAKKEPVACFPLCEYWLDIGQHADYQKAQIDIRTIRFP